MKTIYRYPRNKYVITTIVSILALWLILGTYRIYTVGITIRIIPLTLYFVAVVSYFVFLFLKGNVTIDPQKHTLTITPGKRQIDIDKITALEIFMNEKQKGKVNIKFSDTHFTTIQIEQAEEFVTLLSTLNPNIQIEKTYAGI